MLLFENKMTKGKETSTAIISTYYYNMSIKKPVAFICNEYFHMRKLRTLIF